MGTRRGWELFRGFPYTREYARDGCCLLQMLELADALYEVILTNCSLGFQLTNKIKCLRATLEWLLNLFYELLSALLDISYKTLQLCCVICRQKKR